MGLRSQVTLLLLLVVLFNRSFAQNDFRQQEDTLSKIQHVMYAAKTEAEKLQYFTLFNTIFQKTLSDPGSFGWPFDSLKEISRIQTEDGSFKLITWDLPHSDGTYNYFGYVQWRNEKKHKYKLTVLADKSRDLKNPEGLLLDAQRWFGAVYYKIIAFKSGKRHYYALLGWQGYDKLTNKKLIDVLSFDNDGGVKFGAEVFKWEKKSPKRLIFEYSSQVVMSLKFEPENKRIIFDHLSPPQSKLEGQYQYYGPDWSIDCVALKKGKWFYISDIDARSKPTPKDNTYSDPKQKKKDYQRKNLYSPTAPPLPAH